MDRQTTPASAGELIERIHNIANALYNDLTQDSPQGDKTFDIRLHNLILMLKRFETQVKREC